MKRVVLLRHGESTWNKENRFTGWTDVELSEKGVQEALEAGRVLRREGYVFDLAWTFDARIPLVGVAGATALAALVGTASSADLLLLRPLGVLKREES